MVPPDLNTTDFSSFLRSDGKMQTTFKGMPLYYYIADTSPGQTAGQALNQFGGPWYVVFPNSRRYPYHFFSLYYAVGHGPTAGSGNHETAHDKDPGAGHISHGRGNGHENPGLSRFGLPMGASPYLSRGKVR